MAILQQPRRREADAIARSEPAFPHYDSIAPWYDFLAGIYSLGAIQRAKEAHLAFVRPGQHILYAGGGRCLEGIRAAQAGAQVTILDASTQMLHRAGQAARQAGVDVELVHAALSHSAPARTFDHVVAPFFLNVFSPPGVHWALSRLCELVVPGQYLSIVDFRGPSPQWLLRIIQKVYYLFPLCLFSLIAKNPWHELYDYRAVIGRTEWELEELTERSSAHFAFGFFESMTFRVLP